VQASLRVRDLVIASWEDERENLDSALPDGVEAAPVDDRFIVSLAAFRVEGGRVGRVPVVPYAQLNVRTPIVWKDEAAVFFLAARVTAGGLPGALLGAPFRYARLRVEEGRARAPGRGISLRYRVGEPTDPGRLADVGLFDDDGVREFRIERAETEWRRAHLLEPAQADFLLALGFHPLGEPELVYARRTTFRLEVPRRRKSG
jgi:hypothetical protein